MYRSGLSDLAEGLCKVIEKKGDLSAEAKVGVRALHLDLRFDLAQKEADVIKRKELLKAVLAEKEELVQQYPAMKEGVEAAETLPDVYRALGETITVAVQKTSDVAEVAALQKEGEQVYAQAEEKLKAKIAELEPVYTSSPANERLYMSTRYNLPRTYYYHSLLYPAGEWKKKDLLEKAVEGFQQFGLDYSNDLLYFEGLIFEGLANKDLGKPEDAIASLDEAIGLSQYFADEKGEIELSLPAADVISRAALQKVLLQTEIKDYAGATATSKAFLEASPSPSRRAAASVSPSSSRRRRPSSPRATRSPRRRPPRRSSPWTREGAGARRAEEVLARIIGGGSGEVDASQMLSVAGRLANKGEEARAIQVAHQGIISARGSPQEANVGCEGYVLIGNIYLRRGEGWSYEAALAFETAYKKWPKAEKAPEAVYQAMSAYSRLYTDDKRPWFKKRADDGAKVLAAEYPTHPRAAYAQLMGAKQLADEGKFLEAAAEYQRVQPSASSYLEAQFRAGTCYFQQARKLCADKKEGEADQYVKQSETLLKKARTDLEAAIKATMNLEEQAGTRARPSRRASSSRSSTSSTASRSARQTRSRP